MTDNDTDRDAITRAAAAYDKIEATMQKLREQLDEANAHLKAQGKLIEELQLQLSQERNTSSTYRAEAEQARADSTALMTLFANTKALFDGFEIPSERLPMRRKKNGKPATVTETPTELPPSPGLDDVEVQVAAIIAADKRDALANSSGM